MDAAKWPEKTIKLSNGKTLTYLTAGDPESQEFVFYFHGFPGSRVEGILLDDEGKRGKLNIIACDRPGLGGSDRDDSHTVANWGEKVREIADKLGIDRFSVIGVSGGAPYAASTAITLPDRVKRLALVSGMAPVNVPGNLEGMIPQNRWLLREGSKRPWLVRPAVKLIGKFWQRSPAASLFYLKRVLPEADKKLLAAPGNTKLLKQNLKLAFRNGVDGALQEFWNLVKPWDLDLKKVVCPTFIWHGLADNYVPVPMARWLSDSIPGSKLHLIEDRGHFMALEMAETVLKELIPAYGDSPDAVINR